MHENVFRCLTNGFISSLQAIGWKWSGKVQLGCNLRGISVAQNMCREECELHIICVAKDVMCAPRVWCVAWITWAVGYLGCGLRGVDNLGSGLLRMWAASTPGTIGFAARRLHYL